MKEAIKELADIVETSKAASAIIEDINRRAATTDEYTEYVEVAVKHRTHVCGFRGDPYYTYHTEARFNQRKYDHDVSAPKAIMENAAKAANQVKIKINIEAQKELSKTMSEVKNKLSTVSTSFAGKDVKALDQEYQIVRDCESMILNNHDAYTSCVSEGNNYRLQCDYARIKADIDRIRPIKEKIERAAKERIDVVGQADKILREELASIDRELTTLIQHNSELDVGLAAKRSHANELKQEVNFWQQKDSRQQEVIFRTKEELAVREEKMMELTADNELQKKKILEMQTKQRKFVESKTEKQRSEALLKALSNNEASDQGLIDIIKVVGFDPEYLAYLSVKKENVKALNVALFHSKKLDSYTLATGETLLQYAINNKKVAQANMLLAATRDKLELTIVKALSLDDQKTIEFLVESDRAFINKLFYGQTIFEIAVIENQPEIAGYLRNKIDVERHITTILDRMQRENKVNIESVKSLLEFSVNDIGAAVMYFALEKDMIEVVQLLLQYRADDLQECLLIAIDERNKKIVDKILAINSDLAEKNTEILSKFSPAENIAQDLLEEGSTRWGGDTDAMFVSTESFGTYFDMSVAVMGNTHSYF